MTRISEQRLRELYNTYLILHDRRERRRLLYSKGTNKPNGILMTPEAHRLAHHSK